MNNVNKTQRQNSLNVDLDNCMVTLDLVIGRKRMNRAKFRPGERDHAAGAVELHCAAAQRNHAVHETQILRREMVDITEHLSLRVMFVKDRMRQVLGSTLQGRWDGGS